MKKAIFVAALAAASLQALAADVGVSVQISQPGVYGRIDIGAFPQPVVVMPRPVVIHRPVVVVAQPQPIYMWVPPGHRKDWRRHCGAYGACGVPVYFVQDQWYDQQVMQGRGHADGHGNGKGKDKSKGNGKGHDKGRDKGHDD